MIASLASSLLYVSCVTCSLPLDVPADPIPVTSTGSAGDVIQFDFRPNTRDDYSTVRRSEADAAADGVFYLPMRTYSALTPGAVANSAVSGRIQALDLSTPYGVRSLHGDNWGGELTFSAAGHDTGLGLDVQVAPRAQFQRDRAGQNSARAGAEIRFGQGLLTRDLRGKNAPTPAWYLFVGADGEALAWNVADRDAMDGLSLRDQTTVGDLQAGIAWKRAGGQLSFGLVQRKLSFNNIDTGKHDLSSSERFAALSFTVRR